MKEIRRKMLDSFFSLKRLLPALCSQSDAQAQFYADKLSYKHCNVLKCTPLYCTALSSTAQHCNLLHFPTLHCPALYCTALHCTLLHCTALHSTALHCTEVLTMSYSALHNFVENILYFQTPDLPRSPSPSKK